MNVLVACEFSGVVRDAFAAHGHNAWSCDLRPSETPGLHYQGDVMDLLDGWQPVMFAAECDPDGDGWCAVRDVDPGECDCLGPTQDGVEYREVNGVLLGRKQGRPYWDVLIAHPPCTYLCNSSVWALTKTPPHPTPGVLYGRERWSAMEDAARFFRSLLNAPIPKIAIENPIMHGHAKAIIGVPYQQIIHPHQFGDDASKATCLWLKGLPPLISTNVVAPRIVNGKPRWANQTDGGQNKLTPSADRWAKRSETYRGIAAAMAQQWA